MRFAHYIFYCVWLHKKNTTDGILATSREAAIEISINVPSTNIALTSGIIFALFCKHYNIYVNTLTILPVVIISWVLPHHLIKRYYNNDRIEYILNKYDGQISFSRARLVTFALVIYTLVSNLGLLWLATKVYQYF